MVKKQPHKQQVSKGLISNNVRIFTEKSENRLAPGSRWFKIGAGKLGFSGRERDKS
jgi:hypothetical protein